MDASPLPGLKLRKKMLESVCVGIKIRKNEGLGKTYCWHSAFLGNKQRTNFFTHFNVNTL
jgi:hypothetical protein